MPPRGRRIPWAAIAAATLALAGCRAVAPGGGSGAQPIAFAACMRSHGVPDFPDPRSGGFDTRGGPSATTVNGVTLRESPAQVQAAQTACQGYGGTPGGGGPASPRQQQSALAYAQCMRSHGIPDFPDPKVTATSLRVSVPPGTNPQSPGFRAARQACRPLLAGVLGRKAQGEKG